VKKEKIILGALVLCLAAALPGAKALAQSDAKTIKIGLLAPFSGPFADFGDQMVKGIELYIKQHGDSVAGKKIEILKRDANGIDPAQTQRQAQELITRDHVAFLAGFGLTPDAMAVASMGTEAKVPMVIMNAATGGRKTASRISIKVICVSTTIAFIERIPAPIINRNAAVSTQSSSALGPLHATSALSVRQSLPIKASRLVVENRCGMSLPTRAAVRLCQQSVLIVSVWHSALSRRMPLRSA